MTTSASVREIGTLPIAKARVLVLRDRQWIAATCDRLYARNQTSEEGRSGVGSETVMASNGILLHSPSAPDLMDLINQTVGTTVNVAMHYTSTDRRVGGEPADAWERSALRESEEGDGSTRGTSSFRHDVFCGSWRR